MHVVSALLIAGQRPIGKRGINNPEPLANLSGCTGTVPLDVGIREKSVVTRCRRVVPARIGSGGY